MTTKAVFYVRTAIDDEYNVSVTLDSMVALSLPEELSNFDDIVSMEMMEMDDLDEARSKVLDAYGLSSVARRIEMMGMRARFNSDVNGPYMISFPDGISEADVYFDLVDSLLVNKSKEELSSFLKSAKI